MQLLGHRTRASVSCKGPYGAISVYLHYITLHYITLQYADDTQLYVSLRPSHVIPFDVVSHCISNISRWFLENGTLLNPSKTEAVLFGTREQRKKCNTSAGIDVAGIKVACSATINLLCVTLEEVLSLDCHVTVIGRGCSYHLRALRHIRQLNNLSAAQMVAQGVVTSKLDYCNGLLY